ncbi:MAG: hypothetical protein JO040_12730, partial [Gemmatimonadetes bacterium]|nr:hypothetical protein [Gemmatimonadota bacterium]
MSCKPDRTIQQCYERYVTTGGRPVADTGQVTTAAVVTGTARRLQAKPTGNDLSAEGPLTAIRDFLPQVAAALLAPTTGGDPSSLGFKANLPLNDGVLFDWGVTGQLALVAHEAQPFEQLVESIPASLREAARTRLARELEPYDDVSLTGSLNLESRSYGRSLRQHREDISRLATELLEPYGTNLSPQDRANQKQLNFRMRLDALVRAGSANVIAPGRAGAPECVTGVGVGEVRFDCFTPAIQDSIETAISSIAGSTMRDLQMAEQRIRSSGFLHLAQLVNNQPQINANWEYRTRRDVVGPDEWMGTVRYEMGFANMNGLRHHCGQDIRARCLATYVRNRGVKGSLARADRVWAQVDFTRRSAWHVRLPEDSVDLALGTATALALSGGYGAYFGNAEDGENRDRMDVKAKYDFTRDDPIRQNRLVATLFYTRRLSDQSSALIGFTWANRPEFLGDVDRKLRANLGLTYKINQSPQSVAGGNGAAAGLP